MKKILFCLLVITCQLQAQEKVNSFVVKAADNSSGVYNFTDLDYTPEAITLYGRLWQLGTLSATKDGKKTDFGGGNRMVPSAVSIGVTKDGQKNVRQEFINLRSVQGSDLTGYDYSVVDLKSNKEFASSNDKTHDAVMVNFPKSFNAAKESTESFYNLSLEVTMFKTYINETVTQYTFDRVRNKLIAQKPERSQINPKLPELDGKYLYESPFFKDNKRRMLAFVAGVSKKGEDRFAYMRNRKVVTVNSTGEIVNAFDVAFTYARSVLFAAPLGISVTDTVSNFEDGGIFIFGRVLGAGKNNDPDPTNYDYVIVGSQGELKSKGSFKFGSEKKDPIPVYAYKKDGKIYVLAKAVGKDAPGYALLTFDDSGLIATKEIATPQLKTATFGPYEKGLTTGYSRRFKVTNHLNLNDGGVLLCGEAFEDVTPAGANINDPKVNSYFSQVYLYIDREGNITKNIVIEKLEADSKKNYTYQTFLQEKDNKYYFVSEERSGSNSYPVLTTVDPLAGTAKKLPLKADNIFNIDGDIIYRHFPERGEVLFLGRTTDKDSYSLSCSVYKLN